MTSGYVSRWRRNTKNKLLLSEVKKMLNVNYNSEIHQAVVSLIDERNGLKDAVSKLAKDLNNIKKEFRKKKTHHSLFRVVQDRRKISTHKCYDGVLYFNDKLIGTKVIVWRK